MSFSKDFRAFIAKGNVLDLAVAVVLGAAFGAIVSALVEDIIMPLIAKATGGINFSDKFTPLDGSHYATLAEAKAAGANVIAYGHFIQMIVNFLIIAFSIFVMLRILVKKKEEAPAPAPVVSSTDTLLMEIRDELRRK